MRVGGCLLAALVLTALTAPLWVKAGGLHDPVQQFLTGLDEDGRPLHPGGPFVAGTDNLGRDVFSRVVFSAPVSMAVGVAGMLPAPLIGVIIMPGAAIALTVLAVDLLGQGLEEVLDPKTKG